MGSEPAYQALHYLIDEIVFVHDASRRTVFVSPSVKSVLGYTEDDFKGRSTASLVHPEDLGQLSETGMSPHQKDGASYRTIMRVRHANGHYVWCEVVGRNLLHTEVKGIVNTLRDISDRRALEDRLLYQATHDELTQLPNRRFFLHELDGAVTRSGGLGIGVLMLDVDGLKPVNDRLGHLAGDDLLRRCAEKMRGAVRGGDVAARIGGDEFGVLCRRVKGPQALYDAAERIRCAMRATCELGEVSGRMTVSVGARPGRQGDDAIALLRDADAALYAAKRSGRDRVVLASA